MPQPINLRSDVVVNLEDRMGSDKLICNAARVSTNNNEFYVPQTIVDGKDRGLIRYLMRHRHGSPFEHNGFVNYVEAPIFVFREFHRHRVWSYNEMSARYTEMLPDFYVPGPERKLVQIGKVGEYKFEDGSPEQFKIAVEEHKASFVQAWKSYSAMLEAGIAKEVARDVLPVGMYSKMYATCNMRALMHFLSLRTQDGRAAYPSTPLHEINMVATKLEAYLEEYFPATYEAFNDFGRVSP